MNDQIKKETLYLIKSLKSSIVRRINEENDQQRRQQMMQSIENIKNNSTNDCIHELRRGFPNDRVRNHHLTGILDGLQNLQQNNNELSLEINQLIKDTISSMDFNDNNDYFPYICGTVITIIGIGLIFLSRKRRQ